MIAAPELTERDVERFWSKVDIRGPDDCWLWNAALTRNGYGQMWARGRIYKTHRLSFVIANGRLPEGVTRHKCDVRSCVNPSHLEEGTVADNALDMCLRGRQPSAILSVDDVVDIRARYAAGERIADIARDYGRGWTTIEKVVKRYSWKHVSDADDVHASTMEPIASTVTANDVKPGTAQDFAPLCAEARQ